jgi:uncharacterized membrane protein
VATEDAEEVASDDLSGNSDLVGATDPLAVEPDLLEPIGRPAELLRKSYSMAWEGPLPPPEIIRQYNEIIPNGADRIMKMAEAEQSHRHTVDQKVVNSLSDENTRGQWFAFLLAISVLGIAAYLFSIDKDGAAVALVTADFLVIAGSFIGVRFWKSRGESEESEDKG